MDQSFFLPLACHPGRVGHLYRREWGTTSTGLATCMGCVARMWPPCHGGGISSGASGGWAVSSGMGTGRSL